MENLKKELKLQKAFLKGEQKKNNRLVIENEKAYVELSNVRAELRNLKHAAAEREDTLSEERQKALQELSCLKAEMKAFNSSEEAINRERHKMKTETARLKVQVNILGMRAEESYHETNSALMLNIKLHQELLIERGNVLFLERKLNEARHDLDIARKEHSILITSIVTEHPSVAKKYNLSRASLRKEG
eukprot:maker-scaffold_56-snap-gene-1.75-mRNA-1 protein AED:0.14 eAED:0.14 QI:1450/1/0.5/1/0/0/2/0/188